MISYEYMQFLNEKVVEYLPRDRVRIGDRFKFRCPLCGDGTHGKKRGFWYSSTASFYCFNCSTGMSGIRFLQFLSGSDYDDLRREFVRLFVKSGLQSGLSSAYEVPKDELDLFKLKPAVRPEWKKPLTPEARAYLDGRMVTSAPFLREDLYSCECGNGEYILIPWVVNGVEAYYQLNDYRKLGRLKYVFPKNSRKLLYGLDNVDMSWPYVICFEGVYDSLFVKNAVACGTKSITDHQARLISERYPNHTVCVSFDNDRPGLEAMAKLVESGADVRFFKWFESGTGAKDVNEFVLETGNPNAFSDRKALERMMLTPLQMKMWLAENGMLAPKREYRRAAVPTAKSATLDLKSRRGLFE